MRKYLCELLSLFFLTVNNSVDKTQLDYNEIAKYRNT